MAKKKPKSGKRGADTPKVPEASLSDVFDDPGPTRALKVPKPVGPPIIQPWDDEVDGDDEPQPARRPSTGPRVAGDAEVFDDPGPTKALAPAGPRQAADAEVFDDPGPTRALTPAGPRRAADAEVFDDPGPTKALPLEEEPELDAAVVHDDPGPTRGLPSTVVLDEIETAMALGRLDEVKAPLGKKKPGKKR